jgi:hypothetical protein
VRDIPGQHWVYRNIRTAKCPIIYIQYDAYLPMFLPCETRGEPSVIWGSSIRDLCSKSIFVLQAGKNTAKMEEMGYGQMCGHINFMSFKHDLHAVAISMLDKLEMEPVAIPDKSIAFVGKHRRHGSRGGDLLNLSKLLDEDLAVNDYHIALYGKWGDLNDIGTYAPNCLKYYGELPRGSESVLNAYNRSKYALVAGNDLYIEFQQYTIRLYEVIASGTIPIFEREWFNCWSDLFGDFASTIDELLCYDTLDDVPDIVFNLDSKFDSGEVDRLWLIDSIRKSLRDTVTPAYVRSEVKKVLRDTALAEFSKEYIDSKTREVIDRLYQDEAGAKRQAVKDAAEEHRQYRLNNNFGDNYTEMSRNVGDLRHHYIFQNTEYSDEKLIELFGR